MGLSPTTATVLFPFAAVVSLSASAVLVSRLESLASRWGLSEAMLGFVVALAADSPEITSAMTASAQGQRTIGTGVVLGSNVFNLAALLGLSALVARRITLHRKVVLLDGTAAAWVAVVSLVTVSTGLAAVVALVLILVVVVPYVVVSASSPATLRRFGVSDRATTWLGKAVEEQQIEVASALSHTSKGRHDLAAVGASLAVVVMASLLMEQAAQDLGNYWQLPKLIVGGVALAAVTSLPNAAGAIFLAARGRGPAVLSEAMNSNMLNVVVGLFLPGIFLGVGGVADGGLLVAAWYAGLTIVSLTLAFAGRGLGRSAGLAILGCYAVFVLLASTY
ncbi:MAG TPA: hypothetical protein VL984_03550 [Acidimicrobiales bacterium]|nr:hypothetical protein [Acidimicrobiales bacterium]